VCLAFLLSASHGTEGDGEPHGFEPHGLAASHALRLADAQAQAVIGGMAADILWPNADNYGQSYDNLRFKVKLEASQTGTRDIGAFVGSSNKGTQSVTLSGSTPTGTYHRRTFWPYGQGQKFDLVMKYESGGSWYDCAGTEPSADDQYPL